MTGLSTFVTLTCLCRETLTGVLLSDRHGGLPQGVRGSETDDGRATVRSSRRLEPDQHDDTWRRHAENQQRRRHSNYGDRNQPAPPDTAMHGRASNLRSCFVHDGQSNLKSKASNCVARVMFFQHTCPLSLVFNRADWIAHAHSLSDLCDTLATG